jgi:DNA-binding MarR family transcriptional regulator
MDDVEDFVVLQARAFGQKVQNAVLRDALAHEDLPVLEWQLLFSVARFGSCHLAHITSRTSIDPAHGSRAAAALETKGLIERRSDPDNRRRKLISLTPEGVRTFDRIWPQAKRIVQSVTDQFSEDEFRVFKCLLAKANMAADKLAVTETVDAEKTGAQEDNRLRV